VHRAYKCYHPAIREAKINTIKVIQLDFAKVCGSISHQLIFEALEHYHIPDLIQGIIRSCFSNIKLRFTVGDITACQALEKGIVTGCTISCIVFVTGMYLIIKTAEKETRELKTSSGIRQPPNRGFMDDLMITKTANVQAQWIPTALGETVGWTRMRFKLRKSRSWVIKRVRVTEKFQL